MKIKPHKCLWCDNKFDIDDIMLIKVPEGACFHMECSQKFPDDNIYPDWNWWLAEEFFPWITIERVD